MITLEAREVLNPSVVLIPVDLYYDPLLRPLGVIELLTGAPLIILEGEHGSVHWDSVVQCSAVLAGLWIVDLVQTPFLEEVLGYSSVVGVFSMMIYNERGEYDVANATLILLLEGDDRMFLLHVFGQLTVCSTMEAMEACNLA